MTMTATISGGRVLETGGHLPDAGQARGSAVTISGGVIEAVGAGGRRPAEAIDATGLIVAPGFIDLQINGGFGIDLSTDPAGMWDLGAGLARHGVTGFLPTIISSPPDRTAAAIDALRRRPPDHVGAEPLGLHFEGPMLSPARPGAHHVGHLAAPSSQLIGGWSRDAGVVVVTMAPELDGAIAVIADLVGRGIVVSAGHTDATAEQARAGIEAGVTLVTHLFNAMAPMGHRSPNLAGVALADPDLAASLIIDGVHLAPEVVTAVWNAKGPTGVVVITDAVGAMGMGPGTYRFGGRMLTADRDRVGTAEGILAGSILTMDRAVRNLARFTGCGPGLALLAASAVPARVIGETGRGRIEPGAAADLVLLDDDLEVQITIGGGRITHVAAGARRRVPAGLLEAT